MDEAAEQSADRFQRKVQVVGDITTGHGQVEHISLQASRLVTRGHAQQEDRQPLFGTPMAAAQVLVLALDPQAEHVQQLIAQP
ncbi:hypothetical protein D3C78_1772790 [compost metagenome]